MRKLLFLFPITLVMATVMSCSGKGDRHTVDSVEFDGSASASASAPAPTSTSATSDISVTSDTSAPSNVRSRYIGNLREVFNDSNYVHWASAEKVGIKPLGDRREREERHDERAHQRHEHRVFGEAEHNAERERREAQRAADVVNAL